MHFGIFKKRENKTSNHIIVDIGSGSVGAALLVMQNNQDKTNFALTKIVRKELKIDNNIGFPEFVSLMNSGLKEAITSITTNSGKIKDVHIFLSSPWYASQSRDVKMKRDKPFVISKKVLVDLVNKESSMFENTFLKKYEGIGKGIKLIEKKVIDTRLNGYHIQDAIGKSALSLEMSLFFSMSPSDIVENILSVTKHLCQKSKVFFHSSSFSIYMSLRDLLVNTNTFVICDIGAELTEVSIVSGGVLMQSASFPEGTETFVKGIMKKTNKSKLEALSYMRMYTEGTLSEVESSKFVDCISETENIWMKSFTKSLESVATAGYIPRQIYLFTKSDTKKYFEDIIKQEPLYGKQGAEPFTVIPVDSKFLSELVKVSSSENRDVSLMVSSYYMVKYINHHQLEYAENY